jgi:hypothetical protein
MDDARATRLIDTALRCYPARWRLRHAAEAAELAALLIKDGTPPASIALSYLAGAARERLTPRPGPRLTAAACALLVVACSVGAAAGLLASAAPARAASTRAASTIAGSFRAASSRAASSSAGRASQRPARPPDRPGANQPVADVLPALGHPSVIGWEAGHGRSR